MPIGIQAQTKTLGIADVDLQQILAWQATRARQQQAHHTAVSDQQQPLSRMALLQAPQGSQHTRFELQQRLAIRRCERIGIGPEATQRLSIAVHQLCSSAPFPITEMQLLQIRLVVQRQGIGQRDFLGKPRATLQWRADQAIPGAGVLHRCAQLRPALLGQRIIQAATQPTAQLGFTVTQQFQMQHQLGLSATAASAKVAICPCKAQARRSSGTANAAPLPSPRRKPSSNSGSAASACSTRT